MVPPPAVSTTPGAASHPAILPSDFRLPLRITDFDAGLAGLLHAAINGDSRRESLNGFCSHLARTLKLRLALLARRAESGILSIEAASAENGLWLELHHIPERWDGGLSSQGPGGEALRVSNPVQMRARDEGFALWRAAAEAERAHHVLAVPMSDPDGPWVLELFWEGELARGASTGTVSIDRLAHSTLSFIADLRAIEQQALVARALTSAGNAAFITDLDGTISWSNPAFSALSGYSADEVRGRNPSMLSSGQQGLRYYRELWATIRAGKMWSGETVDRAKDGHDYEILQTVSPVAQGDRITHYVSIHQDFGRERRERARLERASHLSPDTGLLTRSAFIAAVERACAEARDAPMALIVVGARGLQRAALGDELETLFGVALGKRVREAFPEPDIAGTLGRFEYGLLVRHGVAAEARLRHLREVLAEPLADLSPPVELDLHCGVARFPEHGRSFRELLLKADRQLADEPHARAQRSAPH